MTTFFLAVTVKAAIILLCALVLNLALRKRGSAALRHFVWIAALLCIVLLPAVSLTIPPKPAQSIAISTALLPAASGRLASNSVASGQDPASPVPFDYSLIVIWAAGALLVSARIAIGLMRIARITRRAAPGSSAGAIRLRWSGEIPAPLTWGILRPVVLLPAASANCQPNWLRLIENHELAHVARKDWLSQMLAQAACALYWFHPLAWFAAAAMRREAERACDDMVLATGTDAVQYASCLLDVARAWSLDATLETGTLAMARPSGIEMRLRSILDTGANRRPVKRASLMAAGLAALALLLVLGPARSIAQESAAGMSGSIFDPSGAAVPHALVEAKSTSSDREEITHTDEAGAYSFPGLAPGEYEIDVKKAGFAVLHREHVNVDASQNQRLDLTLQVGPVLESMDVIGVAPPPPEPAAVQTRQRIRVGGDVQATKLLTRVTPVYPAPALAQGIHGSVLLHAVIGTDGNLLSITPLNTLVDPALTAAAIDAVKQWRYQPTLLNGIPVEVVTTITVNFQLARRFKAPPAPASNR